MTTLPRKFLFAGILGALIAAASFPDAPAQPPAVAPEIEGEEGDVLARGPVHEAYASSVEMPKAGEIAPKGPPDPIEELPPDQKPEGDNVLWIPGYWDWDEERTDFIWISGFWRVPPPNHVWVPGSWNRVTDGFQWTSGFWQLAMPNQAQPELEYLPPPPQPIELGPTVPAPDETSIYVTGSWVWRDRYVWRPGYWIGYRPGWLWTPAHYRWTPLGYVFINGYWDYPLANRGVLFAPVYYGRRAFRPGWVYTPRYVIATPILFSSMFSRRGYSSYYFGDYYGANYGRFGYQPWCAPSLAFAVPGLAPRRWNYDPLWSYYSMNHRQDQRWSQNIAGVYAGRYDGSLARPPRTLAAQNQVLQRAANVNGNATANLAVNGRNFTVNNKDVSQHVMVAPLAVAPKIQTETKFQPITREARQAEAKNAAEIRQFAVNRSKAEAAALKSRPPMGVPAPGANPVAQQPVKVKLDVPKSVRARAQAPEGNRQPPPAPMLPKFDPKVEPPAPKGKIDPTPMPKSKIDPTPTPKGKIDPTPMPKGKIDPTPMPKGKIDPTPMPKGKIDPIPQPKGKIDPVPQPKVEIPRPKVEPPKVENPRPKVDQPKQPRVEPPKQPVVPPRVEPPKQPRVEPPKQPVIPPRAEPPKQPRVDPPKQPVIPPRAEPPKQPRVEPPKQPVVPQRVEPPKQPRVDPPKQPVVPQRVEQRPVVQPRSNPAPQAPVAQPRQPVAQPRQPVVQPRQPVVQPRQQAPARSQPQARPDRGNPDRRR